MLIFAAILVYRLYRTIKSTMLLVKAASKIAHDTVTLVQEGIKPLTTILALIQGIRQGFERFSKKFRKENNEGEKMDRKTLAGFGIVLLAGAVISRAKNAICYFA